MALPAHRKAALAFAGLAVAAVAAFKVWDAAGRTRRAVLARSELGALLRSGRAPEITAADPSGKTVTLADLRGRLVLLNLWYTDCEPCRDEMPSLDALAARVAGRGAEVVALSVDPSWEKVGAFHATLFRAREPAYRLLLDPRKETPPRYGTFKFPETFLISPDGELLARFVGPRDWSSPAAHHLLEALGR